MKKITYSKILGISNLTESTYILKLEKVNFEFKAGQYLVLNVPGEYKAREYSIYSPEEAPTIDLLIKEVDGGEVSKELKYTKNRDQSGDHWSVWIFCAQGHSNRRDQSLYIYCYRYRNFAVSQHYSVESRSRLQYRSRSQTWL